MILYGAAPAGTGCSATAVLTLSEDKVVETEYSVTWATTISTAAAVGTASLEDPGTTTFMARADVIGCSVARTMTTSTEGTAPTSFDAVPVRISPTADSPR